MLHHAARGLAIVHFPPDSSAAPTGHELYYSSYDSRESISRSTLYSMLDEWMVETVAAEPRTDGVRAGESDSLGAGGAEALQPSAAHTFNRKKEEKWPRVGAAPHNGVLRRKAC